MQAKGIAPPVGALLDTALGRSEHVLAMAVLYKLQAARELRVASLSVSRADLRAAALCDALARFLSGSGTRNAAPVAMAGREVQALAANPMIEAVLGERTTAGEPRYPHGIKKLNDTAEVAAMIRNGISAQQPDNAVVVVTGPLSDIAAAMVLPDMKELVPKRVRTLVIAATPDELRADLPAARRVLADWASPLVFVETPGLAFPGAQLEQRFAWTMNHPVREAYKAFQEWADPKQDKFIYVALYSHVFSMQYGTALTRLAKFRELDKKERSKWMSDNEWHEKFEEILNLLAWEHLVADARCRRLLSNPTLFTLF